MLYFFHLVLFCSELGLSHDHTINNSSNHFTLLNYEQYKHYSDRFKQLILQKNATYLQLLIIEYLI